MTGENKPINRKLNSYACKWISVLLICSISFFCLTGCSKTVESYQRDSVVQYNLAIPMKNADTSMRFSFSLPLFKICSKEFITSDPQEEYIAGDTAILYGENVEQLDGMSIYLIQDKLSNVVEDESVYFQELKDQYDGKNNTDIEIEDVEESLRPFVDSCYLVSCSMCFEGRIKENVVVESIEIPDLGYQFNINDFKLTLCDVDAKDVKMDDGKLIDYTSYNGCFVDSKMHNMGFFNLEGTALYDIDDIQLITLNDECKITYSEDGNLIDHFELSAKKGDNLENELYYTFENLNPDAEAVAVSLALQLKNDDQTYWRLRYQPSYIEGKYLLASDISVGE